MIFPRSTGCWRSWVGKSQALVLVLVLEREDEHDYDHEQEHEFGRQIGGRV